MTPARLEFVVDFADCDPARIVFYPRYFDWFDRATENLFRERGMAWPQLFVQYRLAGFPIVDANAKFLGPSRFGERIAIDGLPLHVIDTAGRRRGARTARLGAA